MARPQDILWEYKRHTAAKHEIIKGYLDAWIPILGGPKSRHQHLVLIDGFAGPGRYRGGEPGSPLLMLDSFLRRRDRDTIRPKLHYFFIEEHQRRLSHLEAELAKKKWPEDKVEVTPVCARFEEEFPRLIDQVKTRFGRSVPIFAFIDPFGAGQTKPDLHGPLLRLPRCDALIYLPVAHLARFVRQEDMVETLTSVYAGDSWREACKHDDLDTRKQILHDLFRAQLKESCDWVRSFEIVPQAGGNSYYLFFGTNELLGLRKMKAAMWKIDPVAGQVFKDSTVVDHPILFEQKPDLERLTAMLREQFGHDEFTIEEAKHFTLTETPFRDDAHLKQGTLAPAEKAGELAVTRPAASEDAV